MAHGIVRELRQIHENNLGKENADQPKPQLNQYRHLNLPGKAQLLVDYEREVKPIEDRLRHLQALHKAEGREPDPQLFKAVHSRIYIILKQNYLNDFYQKVAQIPTKIFRKNSCPQGLRFNSVGDDIGGHEERENARLKQ